MEGPTHRQVGRECAHRCLQLRLVSLLPLKVSVVTCHDHTGYGFSLSFLCCKRCLRIARDSGTLTTNASGADIVNLSLYSSPIDSRSHSFIHSLIVYILTRLYFGSCTGSKQTKLQEPEKSILISALKESERRHCAWIKVSSSTELIVTSHKREER